MENFTDIAAEFRAAGALVEIQKPDDLAPAVGALLENPDRAREIGSKALECARRNRGATDEAVREILGLHSRFLPCVRPFLPWFLLAWPLARLWQWGGSLHRSWHQARRKSLTANVISIGNITMGGTGKTPFVLFLADRMKRTGHRPGILSRGHGRLSLQKNLVLEPGATVPVRQSGDEPQMFLR
jgi:hypothetical protein